MRTAAYQQRAGPRYRNKPAAVGLALPVAGGAPKPLASGETGEALST